MQTKQESILYTDNAQRGLKIALSPIRPSAPLVAWDQSSVITDLDPMTVKDACPCCFNPVYECICDKEI